MKNCTKHLGSLALISIIFSFTSAIAAPIVDIVDPADTAISAGSAPSPCPATYTCSTGTLSFTHDITVAGFIPGTDLITSAFLHIHLTDAAGGGSENYQYEVGGAQIFSSSNVPSGGGGSVDVFSLTGPALMDLNADGLIPIVITALNGSFSFADSVLIAEFTSGAARSLPEPGSLLLLASAFAALAFTGRRRS